MIELTRRAGAFLLACLGHAIAFGLIVALLFLPFGILLAVVSRDAMGILAISSFGGILGILMGIGQVFIDRFSEQTPDEEVNLASLGKSLLGFYLGPLKPPWWGLLELGQKIVEKDYSRQRPGRWKRGLVGGAALMLLIGLLFGAAAMTSPMPPTPGLAPYMLGLLIFAGIAGGSRVR